MTMIAEMFGPGGRLMGRMDSEYDVFDAAGTAVGRVHRAGGGDVSDREDWTRGEVFANGVVEDDDANEIGYVRATSVYDRKGILVGTVAAQTTTTWITGITDALKAGAALLLLLRA